MIAFSHGLRIGAAVPQTAGDAAADTFFFVHPERAWLLIVPVALLALGFLVLRRQRSARLRYADTKAHPVLLSDAAPHGRIFALVCVFVGMILVAVSALEPAAGWSMAKVERRGVDIVVCLDTSRSMLAEDLAPSRLARAKRDLSALLPRMTGDRIALIAFAGRTRVVCPLTHDLAAFESLLETCDTRSARLGGTDIGGALRAALALLPAEHSSSQSIVLLTDGEDLEGEANAEAVLVKKRGVRLHAIGYGSPRGAKIPADGGEFVRDESGSDVITKLDAEGLREVANACAGSFLLAEAVPLPVVEIFEKRVRPLAQRQFESQDRRRPRSRFQLFLIPGIVVLLLAVFFTGRAREDVKAGNR